MGVCVDRITSYNVCYTKLLRRSLAPAYFPGPLAERRLAAVADRPGPGRGLTVAGAAAGVAVAGVGTPPPGLAVCAADPAGAAGRGSPVRGAAPARW